MKGLREAVQRQANFPGAAELRAAQYRQRRAPELLRRDFSLARRRAARPPATATPDQQGRQVSSARSPTAEPVSIFVFKTLADPFAGRISYFKVMSGVLKNDATLSNFNRGTAERLQHIQVMQGKTADGSAGAARRRYRRGRQAEGHAHRRHARRQEPRPFFYPPRAHSRAFHHFRRRAQDARRRRPHRLGHPQNSGRGPRAAFLAAIRRPRNFCSPARASSTSKWSSPSCASAITWS